MTGESICLGFFSVLGVQGHHGAGVGGILPTKSRRHGRRVSSVACVRFFNRLVLQMVLSHVGPRIWVPNVLCSLSVSHPVKHPSTHTNTHHQATVHPTGISHVGSPKFWQLYGRNRHLQVVNCDGDPPLRPSTASRYLARPKDRHFLRRSSRRARAGLGIGHHVHRAIHLTRPRDWPSPPQGYPSRRASSSAITSIAPLITPEKSGLWSHRPAVRGPSSAPQYSAECSAPSET